MDWFLYDNGLRHERAKLIYGLAMQKQAPICISVISITHCTDFLTHPVLFLPLLFHLPFQYLLLNHRLFGENYIYWL